MKRLRLSWSFVISAGFLLAVATLALFAPWFTPTSYEVQDLSVQLVSPSADHWMGTDALGRDLYTRIVYGGRLSLAVGIVSALVALLLGTLTGAVAGYRGGRWDFFLMRLVDLFYTFPSILLAILLMMVFGHGVTGILIALSATAWVTQARLVRAQVIQIKALSYVESARAMGLSGPAIVLKHILPNLWGPVIVSLTFQIPSNIMSESFLSFIGLGLQPPYSSWGTLASEGFRAMRTYPHLIWFPGLALFLTLIAFGTLGENLRDLSDPTQKR